MIQRKYETLAALYLAMDAAASALAMLAAYWLRFAVEIIPVTKGQQDLFVYARILPLIVVVFPLAFAVQGLYRIRPTRAPAEEWLGVGVGTITGALGLSGLLLWIRPAGILVDYSRATLAIFVACEILLVMLGRTAVRRWLQARYRKGRNLERVLIAGGGELAKAVVARIRNHQELGFAILGCVSDDAEGVEGLPRLGSLADAETVVASRGIDHVFVALPHDSSKQTMDLLDRLTRECVAIHVVPDLLQFMALRSRVEDVDGLPTINLSETPLDGWSLAVKRLFDIAVSATALAVTSPLMALIAVAIKLEDRGTVFYRQQRMGLDGVAFSILKFRSMTVDAEATGARWAEKDDPRRTRVGRWIRGWSLDELPQLWNVLRGDMSLVGPRPERPEFVALFRSEYPHYMLRHKVRAGITGWAQVHGWRGNTSVRMRLEHDLYYIENWSLLLDMKILLMTLRHGLRHENAY